METNSSCDCAIEISQQFARWQARQGGEVYQSSLMSALLAGVYEGETTMADLLRHGDFGLGTFNRLDGELIAFERQIHQLKADGSARPARAEQKTPFAVMTHFRPCLQRRFDHPLSREEIHQWVDRLVGTDNVFVAFRLDGLFEQAQVRTVPCQSPPTSPCWRPSRPSRCSRSASGAAPWWAFVARPSCRGSTWPAITSTSSPRIAGGRPHPRLRHGPRPAAAVGGATPQYRAASQSGLSTGRPQSRRSGPRHPRRRRLSPSLNKE